MRALSVSRTFVASVALVTLFFVTPGIGELLVDAAHYLQHGDTMHDEGHGGADHCCSGAFHFCGCHPRTVAAPVHYERIVLERVTLPRLRDGFPPLAPTSGPTDDHGRELTRPPSA